MTRRQRRAQARVSVTDKATPVADGYQNLEARTGQMAGSLADGAQYILGNPITRQPRQLEYMYRSSWIVGAAVDSVADDMSRAGVDFGAALKPALIENMVGTQNDLRIWDSIGDTVRWGRLYGGSIAVILIDGQDLKTPLRNETVTKGAFRGLLPLGRWELLPSVYGVQDAINAVQDLGPDLGKPKMYQVGPNAPALIGQEIHYTRVIRMEGVRLPFYQRMAEQGWGISIVERMFDRLTAFDSATQGAAQLVFKAYLRTLKIEGLRKILAAGGPAEAALVKNVDWIRKFQSSEGLTLLDAADDFQATTYNFAGLDDLLLQFGQQLSGATEIPLVRLFGQSPQGMSATGESDVRNYYDSINAKQERMLRPGMTRVLDVLHRSVTGDAPPADFNFKFNPLWQMTEDQKATTAKTVTEAVSDAFDLGIITKATALKELKQSGDVTGVFTNIDDDEIKEAVESEDDPPEPGAIDPAANPLEQPSPAPKLVTTEPGEAAPPKFGPRARAA
jgi:phage-related protein (TIGR01555 family)